LQPERSNPYVGPYAFEEADADLFFGRDDEARDLLSLVVSERVVIFFSPSGAGKTSLINVRLAPELKKKCLHVLPVARVGGELPPGISPANVYTFNTLCSLAGGTPDFADLQGKTLDGFLRAPLEADKEAPLRVLILDQFEEVLTTHPGRWEDRRPFFLQLRQALLDDPALSLVLALREDHLAGLQPFATLLPGQLRTRFRLERLQRSCAVDAVRRPAETAGRPFEDGVAERLVDDLSQLHVAGQKTTISGELVEPVQLQVVCYQLWENLCKQNGPTITEKDRLEFGNVDQALERFYDSAVERTAKESGVPAGKIRRWFGKDLITPTRIRSQVSRDDHTSGGLPNAAVDWLVNLHLIRAEATRGGIWYELAHDRFIDPALRSNAKAQPPEGSSLAGDARAWQDGGRDASFLYGGQRLKKAEETTDDNSLALTKLERDFLLESHRAEEIKRTRQTQRLRLQIAVLCVLLPALAGVAYVAFRESWLSKSRELASNAMIKAESDPNLGLRLALAAIHQAKTTEAEAALHRALSVPVVRKSRSLPIFSDSAGAFAFSPDGTRFAAVTEKNRVSLRDSKTGQQILSLPSSHSVITALEISPAGDQIAVGDGDGLISLWRADTGTFLRSLKVGFLINSVAFSPDGKLLAVASDSPAATLWSLATGGKLKSLTDGHSDVVRDVAFNADGTLLATGGDDGLAIVWDVASGRRLGEPLRHPQQVTAVAFSPDGHLATACYDRLLRIWDTQANHGVLKILSGHQDWVMDVAYSPDGRYLASASFDKSTKLWNAQSGEEIHTIAADGGVQRVLFNPWPSGNSVGLAMTAGTRESGSSSLTFWDMLPEEVISYSSTLPLVEIGFRPEGTSLVATAKNGQTVLWGITGKTGPVPLSAPLPTDFQATMARLSFNGRRLAVVETKGKGEENSISLLRVRDIPSGREILSRNLGKSYLPSISLSPDGRYLALGGNLRLWDLQNGEEIPFSQKSSLAVAFNPDGKLLATAGTDDVQIRTIAGKLVRRLVNSSSPILLATFSSDGRQLATASLDLSIRLWDVATGRKLQTLQGHIARVTCLAFSPDGRRLASGSDDTSVKIWDVENGRELFDLHGHSGAVSALAFSPGDGQWLATAGTEGSIRLEPMKLKKLVEIAQSRLSGRPGFTP
jgi:WD40 repeat protein